MILLFIIYNKSALYKKKETLSIIVMARIYIYIYSYIYYILDINNDFDLSCFSFLDYLCLENI